VRLTEFDSIPENGQEAGAEVDQTLAACRALNREIVE
jgi:hypothetical protein